MVVGLGGCGAGCDRYLVDNGVYADAAGKNCRVRHREDGIRSVYRSGDYGVIQQVPQVLVSITWPHTSGEGGRVKDK